LELYNLYPDTSYSIDFKQYCKFNLQVYSFSAHQKQSFHPEPADETSFLAIVQQLLRPVRKTAVADQESFPLLVGDKYLVAGGVIVVMFFYRGLDSDAHAGI